MIGEGKKRTSKQCLQTFALGGKGKKSKTIERKVRKIGMSKGRFQSGGYTKENFWSFPLILLLHSSPSAPVLSCAQGRNWRSLLFSSIFKYIIKFSRFYFYNTLKINSLLSVATAISLI